VSSLAWRCLPSEPHKNRPLAVRVQSGGPGRCTVGANCLNGGRAPSHTVAFAPHETTEAARSWGPLAAGSSRPTVYAQGHRLNTDRTIVLTRPHRE
jgi:hypothetical protein